MHKTKYHSDFLGEDVWNLLDRTCDFPLNFDFTIVRVDKEKYIGRPDLISMDAYGDPVFADVICKLNAISNPFELNVGMVLIIPSVSDIVKFAHKAPLSEKETSYEDTVPSPKKKNEKRQANEAVVGDKRFKIDAAKGIVIY